MPNPIGFDGLPMEFHHRDSSGKAGGPGDSLITRTEHTLIHQSVGETLGNLGLPKKGFCGDATTLKPGNDFFKK